MIQHIFHSPHWIKESALLTSHFEKCTDFNLKNLDEDSFGVEILASGSDVGILNILIDHSVNIC